MGTPSTNAAATHSNADPAGHDDTGTAAHKDAAPAAHIFANAASTSKAFGIRLTAWCARVTRSSHATSECACKRTTARGQSPGRAGLAEPAGHARSAESSQDGDGAPAGETGAVGAD